MTGDGIRTVSTPVANLPVRALSYRSWLTGVRRQATSCGQVR